MSSAWLQEACAFPSLCITVCCSHHRTHADALPLLPRAQAVLVHQLSKRASQNPFRKNRGRVVRVAFHPAKPFFFVATRTHVRVYNLARQALAKKLVAGGGVSCLAVHPSGDHVIVGSEARALLLPHIEQTPGYLL
jgi:hypothetical protein